MPYPYSHLTADGFSLAEEGMYFEIVRHNLGRGRVLMRVAHALKNGDSYLSNSKVSPTNETFILAAASAFAKTGELTPKMHHALGLLFSSPALAPSFMGLLGPEFFDSIEIFKTPSGETFITFDGITLRVSSTLPLIPLEPSAVDLPSAEPAPTGATSEDPELEKLGF